MGHYEFIRLVKQCCHEFKMFLLKTHCVLQQRGEEVLLQIVFGGNPGEFDDGLIYFASRALTDEKTKKVTVRMSAT